MKRGKHLKIKTSDSGSLPNVGSSELFLEGANRFSLNQKDELAEQFEKQVVESFLDKIRVGIEVPNYPQFRDMNEMFLSMMEGIEKISGGYLETALPSLNPIRSRIAEVFALERNAQTIQEHAGQPFEVRVCVTGPYTLASFFSYRDEGIFSRLGNVIAELLEQNLFSNKHAKTSLVSVDEPSFGLMDDPLTDFGSSGRENLLNSWETIFRKIKAKKAQTMIHLHSTSNSLFWEADYLDVIDSHVDDPLVTMKTTGERLESRDKFLKASITINDFDKLIKEKITADSQEKLAEPDLNERVADAWTDIKHKRLNPDSFLETVDTMKRRLANVVGHFGTERVLYAGPECGLKGYPTYETAMECLRRVSVAVNSYK
ncbi:MAG: hypothetical protein JW815_06365 [Candidatus Bathyarchaeota archaeon]|nr:hypothetical protein [Candidatus Bathyarchaeum sp.]